MVILSDRKTRFPWKELEWEVMNRIELITLFKAAFPARAGVSSLAPRRPVEKYTGPHTTHPTGPLPGIAMKHAAKNSLTEAR